MGAFKLIVEAPDLSDFNYVLEEKNSKEPANLYIQGPFMMASEKNRNNRVYDLEEMAKEVDRYVNEMVKQNRAMGELEHSSDASVNLERACHLVTELTQDGNIFYGKSKVLSTPCGQIVRNLIKDDVRVGVSSRALGQIEEQTDGSNLVKEMKLVAVDCVADPSFPKAFVNGILESKQWIVSNNGKMEEVYDQFESSLKGLPKKDLDKYILEQVLGFIKKL